MIVRKVAVSIPMVTLSMANCPRCLSWRNGFRIPGVLWDKSGGGLGRLYEVGNSDGLGTRYEPVDVEIPGKFFEPFDTEIAEP